MMEDCPQNQLGHKWYTNESGVWCSSCGCSKYDEPSKDAEEFEKMVKNSHVDLCRPSEVWNAACLYKNIEVDKLSEALAYAIKIAEHLDHHMNSVQQSSMCEPDYEESMQILREAKQALSGESDG